MDEIEATALCLNSTDESVLLLLVEKKEGIHTEALAEKAGIDMVALEKCLSKLEWLGLIGTSEVSESG